MKKTLFSTILLASAALVFCAPFETAVSLYNELSSSYNSGFYPGAVEYAGRLKKSFPESAYIGSALAMEGECLVRLNRMDEASDVLLQLEKMDVSEDVRNRAYYWLGRVYEYKKDYDTALSYYFECCKAGGEDSAQYAPGVLLAGEIYYAQGEFKKAAQNLTYVVEHGNRYAPADYNRALLKLADAFNQGGEPQKTVALFNSLSADKDNMERTVYYVLTEYAGDAYALQKNYRKAYDLYCQVLASGEKALTANALKKAYNISSEHKKEVGEEPGSVLKNAQQTLSDSPELLAEFWTRLGLDAFYAGDYAKALNYFSEGEKYVSPELSELIAIYRAEITAGKKISKKSASQAEQQLIAAQEVQSRMDSPRYVQDYNRLLVKYAAFQEHWDDVKRYGALVSDPDESSTYYIALAQYRTGDYAGSAKLMDSSKSELYALTLARQQKLKEAARVYGSSDKDSAITPEERLNYAKVLILSGRYREAQIEANKCGLNEGKYILGLAQFNTWSWSYAEESFSAFLKNVDRSDPFQEKAVSYAQFYLGYSQYRQGKARAAYDVLSAFVAKYRKHELLWNAQITAANAAVQLGSFDDGIHMAESAVKSSKTNEDREEAVLLCADIYSDAGRYDSALSLLAPYTKLKGSFGMKSLYAQAQIYEKMKDVRRADATYKEVSDKFGSEKIGEEAMYRRGELFYAAEDYASALPRFTEYSAKYPAGTFVASSWYFAANCMERTQNQSRAILQYQALIKKFPESTYVYGSAKNLVSLYRAEGKYKEALENARFLLDRYGEQARNDGMADVAADLEKLSSGKNEAMVAKENEYRREGGYNTPVGRRAGTELVIMYAKSTGTAPEAIKLAEQLFPLQKKNLREESFYAAQNADILAQAYRVQNKNKAASEMYLSSAEYYRMNKKDDEAAAALYGAYDAFIASGLPGDANETARTLQSLYPQSRYAKNVRTDN